MTDILERLRQKVHGSTYGSGMEVPPLHEEAANYIDVLNEVVSEKLEQIHRLEKENEKLRQELDV